MTLVNIPGVGRVRFPEGMSDADIEAAIPKLIQQEGRQQQDTDVIGNLPSDVLTGGNQFLATLAGAPVSIFNNLPRLMNLVPGIEGVQPFNLPGGIEDMKRLSNKAGFMTVEDISQLPDNRRIAARFGEAGLGAAVTAPLAMAGMGGRAVSSLAGPSVPQAGVGAAVDTVRRSAASNPGAFLRGEAAIAAGAGQGAAAAEAMFPNNPIAGTIGEVTGAIFSPVSAMGRAGSRAVDSMRNAADNFTPGGAERIAARELQKRLAEAGESPEAILKALADSNEFGFDAATRTQSPTLLRARRAAMEEDPNYARRAMEGDQEAVARLSARMDELIGSGDPRVFSATARAAADRAGSGLASARADAQSRFDDQLARANQQADEILTAANTKAERAMARFGGSDQRSRVNASLSARRILDAARDKVGKLEDAIWAQVNRTEKVGAGNTILARQRLAQSETGEAVDLDRMNPLIRRELDKIEDTIQGGLMPTVGEMLKTRSMMLRESRRITQGAEPDFALARVYRQIGDGILDDVAMTGQAAQRARDFSFRMHRQFDDPKAVQQAFRGRGEETLDRAFSGTPATRATNMRELEDVARPMTGRAGDGRGTAFRSNDYRPEMRGAQEDFLRSEIANLYNPSTGRMDTARADRFARDNAPLLERFPTLKRELDVARGRERNLKDAVGTTGAMRQNAERSARDGLAAENRTIDAAERGMARGAPQRVLDAGEQPARAVASALNGPNPARDYAELARLAQQGGPEAVAGLRRATFDHALSQATRADGTIDFTKLAGVLARPVGAGGKSLTGLMREGGVVSTTQAARLQKALQKGVQFEGADKLTRGGQFQLADEVSDAFDTLVRMVSVKAQSMSPLARNVGPGSIVMAGVASRMGRKLFGDMPVDRANQVMRRAMEDEELLKALLTRMDTPRAARRVEQQLNAALLGTGVRALEEDR